MFRINEMENMSDGQIRNEVSKGIASGTIGNFQIKTIIRYLKQNRPEIFNIDGGGFKKIAESKYWDKVYLNQIHNSILCGYFCEDILLHMKKVSNKLLFKYKVGMCGIVLLLVGIICLIISFFKGR